MDRREIDFGFVGEYDLCTSPDTRYGIKMGRVVPTRHGEVQIYSWSGDTVGWNIFFPQPGINARTVQDDPLTVKMIVQDFINNPPC